MSTSITERTKGARKAQADETAKVLARAKLRISDLQGQVEGLYARIEELELLGTFEPALDDAGAEIRSGRLAEAIRILSRNDDRLRDLEYLYHKVHGA